jgi:FixJ family two-component response regulator
MPDAAPIVFVVADDSSVREALESLIRVEGWESKAFGSGEEFVAQRRAVVPSCLVLDVLLPGSGGLELQRRIANERADLPIIVVTAQGDVSTAVQAMKAGAFEFLTKPLAPGVLVGAIRQAIGRSHAVLTYFAESRAVLERYSLLSRREQEVMTLIVAGRLNKQVGGELGICEITVKTHLGRIMRKMKAGSFADLVRMASKLRPEGQMG